MQFAVLKQMQLMNISAILLQIALNTSIAHNDLFYLRENPRFADSVTPVVFKTIANTEEFINYFEALYSERINRIITDFFSKAGSF